MIFNSKEIGINYFKKLGYSIKEGPNWFVVIPFEEEIREFSFKNRYHTYNRKCYICNINFNHGLKTTSICSCCKLFIECNLCKKWFEKERKVSLFINEVQNNQEIIAFCSQKCAKINNGKLTGKANITLFNKKVKTDSDLQKIMYDARSYVGKNFGKKNIYKALESLQNEHHDILIQNGRNVQKWLNENPDERIRINTLNAQKAGERNKELWKDKEWSEKQNKICLKNLEKANEIKIRKIKESLENLCLNISENSININNIFKLKENDICGAYLIRGKYKENDLSCNLLVCKSKRIYTEIYWVLRVLSHPEKQDKVVSDSNPWTIAKWWYIANLYSDFEFILLTNPNGVSEEEALFYEAKYAIDNDMFCDKEQIIRDSYSKNHSYWSL